MRGKFITIEGIDGAGKSSHLTHVADRAREKRVHVIVTREPGGTKLGEALRALVLKQPMDVRTDAFLMFGARAEHLAKVIEPALAAGEWVVCDRFTDSTYAYQCGGHGLPRASFAALAQALQGVEPDATLLFDIDPELAAARQRSAGREPVRFEREQVDFFRRVRAAYLERSRESGGRIRVIDASGTLEEVRRRVDEALAPVLA